jgi:hypothetical protein
MVVCPIAVVAGCPKCPAFKVCPLKSILGDQKKAEAAPEPEKKAARKNG